MGGCRRRIAGALALVAAAIPFAIWIVMQTPGEDWWVGAALVYAPKLQWIAVPVVGLALALSARSCGLVTANVAAAAFAIFVLAGYQLNTPPTIPEDRPVIRLATWNVYGWTSERELVQERILSWDADIVCIQESARNVFDDLLPGYESTKAGDLRVFVRGRIIDAGSPSPAAGVVPRLQIVEVETDAGEFTVINAHIPRGESVRRTPRRPQSLLRYLETGVRLREPQFDQLVAELPEGPVILAGDLNITSASRYYEQISAHLTDSFAEVGRGFGNTFVWRQRLPAFRIDYVWTGGGVTPLRCETRPHLPSDHRPLVAELALPAEPADAQPE
ncbi:MAG: endonuclease/exonuclease/phosphatase family protein [Armatimonadota bacterium]